MVLVETRGLPVAIDTAPADVHESRCVQALLDILRTSEPRPRVIGDKAHDSDRLDQQPAERGFERIAPHRGRRRPEKLTPDRRPLQRLARRWTIERTISRIRERTISRIQNCRRLCIRREKSRQLFSEFLHLSCTRRLLSAVFR